MGSVKAKMLTRKFRELITTLFFLLPIAPLIYLTVNFSAEKIVFLSLILTIFAGVTASPGILISLLHTREIDIFKIPIIGVFAAIIYASNFLLVIFPSFIFYVLPFAAGYTFYLPTSIILGAYSRIIKEKGSMFFLLFVYGVISEFLSPSIFWFPYYLAWGGMLETGREILGETESDYIMGFGYGAIGAGLAVCYMLIGWGYYRPLFMTLPSMIVDGLLASFGFKMGVKIGELTKKISL